MNVVISIAGSDSGGGAGIQADLKTFEAFGVFGTTAITSITAQNTRGVRGVHDLPVESILGQLGAVFDDFNVAAIKIGMLSSAEIIRAVSGFLRERAGATPVVLDPVMIATSGDRLLREDAVESIRRELIPLATIVTPNADEAAVLAGIPVAGLDAMREAAERIAALGTGAVLVKGGHIPHKVEGATVVTDLLLEQGTVSRYDSLWIDTTSTHGTGCTLSSAIAAGLALGHTIPDAIREAEEYVHGAIANAPGLGGGSGPLLHGWRRGDSTANRRE